MKNMYLYRLFVCFTVIFVCFFNATCCLAQLSQVVSASSLYSPPSPNASALLRYANVPVDEHTGVPAVVLPIDQLSGRQLSVPITLSYHGSGNKVLDIASNVGLGFVLNAGGVITRVMRGLPDECPTGYQYYGKRVTSNSIDSVYLNATINSKIDGEPDMFYFNFLGHTGKMVIDTLGNAQYLPDQGIRVISHPIHNSPDSTHNAWILKDFNGTTYIFGADTSSQEITVVNLAGRPITQAISYISSWYLARVISPDGKEVVNFRYTSGPNLSYEQYRNITTYNIHHDVTDKRTGIFSSHVKHTDVLSAINTTKIDESTVIQVLSPKYLSNIQNDIGSITFSYNTRNDLSGGLALYQMMVYNFNDSATPLKTYTFNESYFLSPNAPDPNSPDAKRLKLDCVTLQGRSMETKQLFVFSYNEQTLLPPRNSDSFDHWGYYTTLDDRAGFPPINLTTDKYGNLDDGFDRRAPDSVRIKACILTKIRNINGGYTNLFYTIDDYKYNGGTFMGGGLRIKTIVENDSLGQVVPVVKQYTYTMDDGTTSGMIYNPKPYYIQGIPNYAAGTVVKPIPSLLTLEINTLKNPWTIASTALEVGLTIASFTSVAGLAIDIGVTLLAPAVVDAWDFIFHRTHKYHYDSPSFSYSSTALNNLFDINGASVTYSQVEVLNADGGKTVDYYTSQQEYPDSASAVELNCNVQGVTTIFGNTGSYPPSTSFDVERGLLKRSKAYDNNNNLVSQVINTYQLSKRVSTVAGQRSSVSGYASLSNGGFQVITYDYGVYKEIAQNIQLVKSVTQLYDQSNNGTALATTHIYGWQPVYPTLLRSESTYRSDGNTLTSYITYPMEYAPGTTFLDDMVHHYMLAAPIEKVSTLQIGTSVSITGGAVSRFKPGGLGLLDTVFSVSASNPIPLASFKFSNQVKGVMNGAYSGYGIDKSYIAKGFFQTYDSKDNLIQSQNLGEPASSTIWGYNQNMPIVNISNATVDKVAYTSFETNDQRYWTFTASGRDSSALAKTGKIRYQLSSGAVQTAATLPAGTYIVSLWTQGAKPVIGGTTADIAIVNGESDSHSWNFYMDRVTVSGGTNVSLTGSGFIDELRLYPLGAHMSSVAIIPQVGTMSTASQDDKVNTYEYDALLRTATERDDQYNILKQYSYSNVSPVPCAVQPDSWIGTNPVCFTDQSNILPNIANYSAITTNSYGNIICSFTRTAAESVYLAQLNYTVRFTDSTTYSSSILLKNGDQSTLMNLPLNAKSAESVSGIGIDTVVNLNNDYGVAYQSFQNRQRVRDSYTEANTLSGGLGPYIAPVKSDSGCPTFFTNRAQTNFSRNNCTTGNGSVVEYTVPAGTYSASSQFKADSMARAAGQAYANINGNCTANDTTFVGTNPYCITGTADSGTPSLSAYSITIANNPQLYLLNATITRTSAEAVHDATVAYQLNFNDGSSASYTTPIYKNQQTINISPPLSGYSSGNITALSVTGVSYSALKRLAYANRARYINGVADGYQEANSAGTYYLAPLEDQAACGTWYYSTAQTGFYRNNCTINSSGSLVSYTVPANTDSSMVSQAYADALARARGQVYANSNGTCTSSGIQPQDSVVSIYAGSATGAIGTVDGPAAYARFNSPRDVVRDGAGNLYVADGVTDIRKIDIYGNVTTFAGSFNNYGHADGVGTAATFSFINGIAIDAAGNIYVVDNNRLRKITPAGVVSTIAGNGNAGHVDGLGTAAQFDSPSSEDAIAIGPDGNIYIMDRYYVREVTPGGLVSTIAGNGVNGYVDGPVNSAEFNGIISSMTIDGSGTIYISDGTNNRIRKIRAGIVSTFAGDGTNGFKDGTGTAAEFSTINEMTIDVNGNIYCTDFSTNNCIRKISPAGMVTTITAPPPHNSGLIYGKLSSARFGGVCGIAVDPLGNIYVSDYYYHSIRKITVPQ